MDWIKKNWLFLIGFVLSLSLLWPLVAKPFFFHHDDVQIIRLYEMNKCFADGQIPCRWVPDLGDLYGYPIFNYYAPLPYYFGAIIFPLTSSLLITMKLMFVVSLLGSFVFMYLLSSKLWGKLGGALAAIFYSFAPYHALNLYVRGAMGEMWALMFFPATFWAALKLQEKLSLKRMILFSFTVAGLILSHNLSTMIFLPLLLFWIIWLFLKKKDKRFIWFSLGSIFLGVLLSSFYLFPMLLEKNLVHVETTTYGYFSYTEHFKGLRKLLVDRTWDYGSSIREVPGGEKDGMSYQIGWVHLLGWVLALFVAKFYWSRNRWLSWVIIGSSIVILASIFMIHPRSEWVWKLVPSLKYLQFPWRFLLLIIFFISLISGSIFVLNFKKKYALWIVLVILAVILNFSFFKPVRFIQVTDKELLEGDRWDKQVKRSIFDYLPIYAKEPPAELATERYQILTGDSRIYDFKEGTNWINFKTETKSHTIIRLSQYYFPDWKIFVDGKEVKVEYKNNSLGLMTIILGKGNHIVSARLFDTPVRIISNTITLGGFAITLILFFVSFPRVRKWLTYYRKRMN